MRLRKQSNSKAVLTVVLFLCTVVIGLVLFILLTQETAVQPKDSDKSSLPAQFQGLDLEPKAITGALPGTQEEFTQSGSQFFSYRINSTPVFRRDGSEGNILVENPSINAYLMILELETSDRLEVYQSGYLAPGQYLPSICLQESLNPGQYPATAYFQAVDPENLEIIWTTQCPVTITVKE